MSKKRIVGALFIALGFRRGLWLLRKELLERLDGGRWIR